MKQMESLLPFMICASSNGIYWLVFTGNNSLTFEREQAIPYSKLMSHRSLIVASKRLFYLYRTYGNNSNHHEHDFGDCRHQRYVATCKLSAHYEMEVINATTVTDDLYRNHRAAMLDAEAGRRDIRR